PRFPLLGALVVRRQTGRGRDDRDAEAAEHARQVGRLRIDPQPGLRDAPDTGDRALAVLAELQRDPECPAPTLGVVLDAPAGDVALLLEDLDDVRLDLAVGHRDRVVVRRV